MKAVNFSPSTLAKTVNTSAKPPLVMYCLAPLRRNAYRRRTSVAVVLQARASEPASGLGQGVGAEPLGRGELRQVPLLLLLGAEEDDRQRADAGVARRR